MVSKMRGNVAGENKSSKTSLGFPAEAKTANGLASRTRLGGAVSLKSNVITPYPYKSNSNPTQTARVSLQPKPRLTFQEVHASLGSPQTQQHAQPHKPLPSREADYSSCSDIKLERQYLDAPLGGQLFAKLTARVNASRNPNDRSNNQSTVEMLA